jgi:broad specificity phosphatase PhoE
MFFYETPLALIRQLPGSVRGVFVMRHSIRFPIVSESEVYTAGLTPEGLAQAEQFGARLGQLRQPGRMLSSPVQRCLDTAASIARGAGWSTEVKPEYLLSHPFIEPVWNALPITWGKDPLPDHLARLVDLIFNGENQPGTLDLCVTHDTIVASLAGYFTGVPFKYPEYWPDFLEGVLLWQVEGIAHLRWREHECVIGPWPMPGVRQMSFEF